MVDSKKVIWKFLSSGTVLEDCRAAAFGGHEVPPAPQYGVFRWERTSIDEENGRFDGIITHCYFQLGRKVYQIGNNAEQAIVNSDGGDYYLYILHDSPNNAMILPRDMGNSLT